MPSARHVERGSSRAFRRGLVLGLLAAVLALAAAGAVWRIADRSDGPTASSRPLAGASPSPGTPSAGSAPPAPTSTVPPTPVPPTGVPPSAASAALQRCQEVVADAEAVLASARPGVTSWRAHVQAYHDVVDGRVPYREAAARWTRTRLAGPGDLRRLRQAEREHEVDEEGCQGAAVEADDRAAQCATRLTRALAGLDRARAVHGEWAEHQRAMEAERRRTLPNSRARVLFRAAVKQAPKNLEGFDRAEERLEDAPTCGPGGSD